VPIARIGPPWGSGRLSGAYGTGETAPHQGQALDSRFGDWSNQQLALTGAAQRPSLLGDEPVTRRILTTERERL